MVLLVTGPLSASGEATLRADGWQVRRVQTIENPGLWSRGDGRKFPTRFSGVYTKLLLWNMTEYNSVVFLDSDTLVVRNIDVLFNCPGFCAALRHSERFNTGVMTLHPSAATFADMMEKVGSLPSYTGGDQGFLASYFPDFANSLLFDPSVQSYPSRTQYMRLPTSFNADLGLYVLNNNKWSIPPDELAVVHYTFGPFKPWDWWTTWIVNEVWRWQALRDALPRDAHGLRRGESNSQLVIRRLMLPLPPVLMMLLIAALACSNQSPCWQRAAVQRTSLKAPPSPTGEGGWRLALAALCPSLCGVGWDSPANCDLQANAAGFTSIAAGVVLVVMVMPLQTRPMYAWVIAYEWVLFSFVALFGWHLHRCYWVGARGLAPSSGKTVGAAAAAHPWRYTTAALLLACGLISAAPWWACLAGNHIMFKIVLTPAVVMLTSMVLSYLFTRLSMLWLHYGRAQGAKLAGGKRDYGLTGIKFEMCTTAE